MTDIFWQLATSNFELIFFGLLFAAAMVVGHLPFISTLIPAVAPYVVLARFVAYLALGILGFLGGARVADDREALNRAIRLAQQKDFELTQQQASAEDAERLRDAAQRNADALQKKVDDYEEKLHGAKDACLLDDADVGSLRGLR